jgi:phenylalanyl-tRNA synthetase beta chain
MKLPLAWLRDHVEWRVSASGLAGSPPGSTGDDTRELMRVLDLTGTEVKSLERFGVRTPETLTVGKVLTVERHPDADRLRVTAVDLGDGTPAQIVCGAPNVAAGQTVVVAPPGTVMPDGTKLGVAKLRGVASHGMILSEDELGLAQQRAGGILVLDDAMPAGLRLAERVDLATEVLELEITPNRPDCLSVFGLAREVAAALRVPVGPEPWLEDPGPAVGPIPGFEVTVEVPELCPRFTARLFEDVTIAPSPPWLKARLAAAGQRPINNVVDITNYVMLLVGQPLHAFDADRVAGGRLTVRCAHDGEPMTTLDEVARTLDADMVLIADADGPTSIAGIMGGLRSEVSPTTTRVLLEAATWDGPNVNRTMARLALRSEAGARFEKSLPVEATMWAQAVATRLLMDLAGARPAGGTIDVGGPRTAPDPVVALRDARTTSLLGVEVPRARAVAALERLGFGVEEHPDRLQVTVPPLRRGDVTREADLIEEVGRLEALEDLPATLPRNRTDHAATLTTHQRLRRRAVDALVGRGAHEVVGWSFAAPDVADRLGLPAGDPRRAAVELENPMSEDGSVLRTSLLPSLLDVARRNAARGTTDAQLFEEGAVYLARPRDDVPAGPLGSADALLPVERRMLAALVPGDVFAAKGLLEAVAQAVRAGVEVRQDTEPFLHPGRAGRVLAGPRHGVDAELDAAAPGGIGWLGELHPTVAGRWDLGQVSAFEIDLDALLAFAAPVPAFEDLTTFPEIRQDLAVVLDAGVPAADVLRTVRRAGGDLLASASVFDVYTGAGIPEGRRSIAVALAFRARDRTLTDEDVAPVRERIVAAVGQDLGGVLR